MRTSGWRQRWRAGASSRPTWKKRSRFRAPLVQPTPRRSRRARSARRPRRAGALLVPMTRTRSGRCREGSALFPSFRRRGIGKAPRIAAEVPFAACASSLADARQRRGVQGSARGRGLSYRGVEWWSVRCGTGAAGEEEANAVCRWRSQRLDPRRTSASARLRARTDPCQRTRARRGAWYFRAVRRRKTPTACECRPGVATLGQCPRTRPRIPD